MDMMNNSTGRTSTIFIILIALLLISSTAIGFFMYQKENQMRKHLESQLEDSKQTQEKLAADLKDAKNQLLLLQDKNKEADNKINSLMDEMELNEGLRNALKKENSSLKEAIEAAKKEKDAIRAELDEKAKNFQENQELLRAQLSKAKDIQDRIKDIDQSSSRQDSTDDVSMSNRAEMLPPVQNKDKMELGKIVVGENSDKGRILSVDKESEFVICNLGSAQGLRLGDLLSVYREDQYLGDIKISRVQDEMSAADFVSPLSSAKVHKNDIVIPKQL